MSDVQFVPIVAPIIVPAVDAPQTCDRWKATYPDRIQRSGIASAAQPSGVHSLYQILPADQPQTSDRWQPTYPGHIDRLTLRTSAHLGSLQNLNQILAADQPQTADRWHPSYPDRIDRPKIGPSAHLYPPQNLFPIGPPSPDGNGPIIPVGAYDLWQYTPEVGPLGIPSAQILDTFQWAGIAPTQIARVRATLAAQQQAWAMDRFDAPTAPSVPTNPQLTTFPERIASRPPNEFRARAFTIDAAFIPPQADPRTVNSRPVYPDRIDQKFREATYVWAQPMFGYEVAVPVESWTGWYLDPPVLARSSRVRHQPQTSALYVPDVTSPVTPESWLSIRPDIVRGRLQISRGPSLSAPIFEADITVPVPFGGLGPIYPVRIAMKPGLLSGAQQAFLIDAQWVAPTPVTVPALSTAVYPDRVLGRMQPTTHPDYAAPNFVLDVTLPSPLLAWSPCYPDVIMLARYKAPYWEVEIPWVQPPTPISFRPEWAANINALIGLVNKGHVIPGLILRAFDDGFDDEGFQ